MVFICSVSTTFTSHQNIHYCYTINIKILLALTPKKEMLPILSRFQQRLKINNIRQTKIINSSVIWHWYQNATEIHNIS